MSSAELNEHSYSADGSAERDMRNGGHRQWFIPALQDFLVEANRVNDARDDAQDARDDAQNYAAALKGMSNTSLTVATGNTSLTASTGKQWAVGQHLYIARDGVPTTYLAGQVMSYNPANGALQMDVQAVGGSGTYANWVITIGGAQGPSGTINSLAQATKTGAYTAVSGDKGKLFRLDGTFTLAFQSTATLGNGWWAWLLNIGSGVITLDPNASQLIDGLMSYVMYPGEARLVWCTGTELQTQVVAPFRHTYIASGTFIDPPGYRQIEMRGWGAGGSGGKAAVGVSNAAGGGGGGCMDHQYTPSAGTSRSITIGAGGAGVSSGAGNAGGATEFGSLFSWPGGSGGAIVAGAAFAAGGDAMQGGLIGAYNRGPSGGSGRTVWGGGSSSSGGNAVANSVYGGGAGGGILASNGITSANGNSVYGGNGGAANDATSGAPGTAPGGGGGATRTGASTGAGARGELQIWGVC